MNYRKIAEDAAAKIHGVRPPVGGWYRDPAGEAIRANTILIIEDVIEQVRTEMEKRRK